MRKTRSRPAGATLSNVQHRRTGREEPGPPERPTGAGAQEERSGRNPARPAAALHQSPATRRTAARRAVPEP